MAEKESYRFYKVEQKAGDTEMGGLSALIFVGALYTTLREKDPSFDKKFRENIEVLISDVSTTRDHKSRVNSIIEEFMKSLDQAV